MKRKADLLRADGTVDDEILHFLHIRDRERVDTWFAALLYKKKCYL